MKLLLEASIPLEFLAKFLKCVHITLRSLFWYGALLLNIFILKLNEVSFGIVESLCHKKK